MSRGKRTAPDSIIFPLDVPDLESASQWVERLRGRVGLFKVGLELFVAAGPEAIRRITQESGTGVFLDLKLHDIPTTVERAARAAARLGVRMLTVHAGRNPAGLAAAVEGAAGKLSVLAVSRLTSEPAEVGEIETLAESAAAIGCRGLVCAGSDIEGVRARIGEVLELVCPGIRPRGSDRGDQVRVVTPGEAIARGADYLVIGRPIREARDPRAAVEAIVEEIEAARPQWR